MRRRLPRQQAHEPSLVPLADMLTNTVGIIIFILIFTVLTAGGVLLAKHLPMERKTDKKAIFVMCAGNRILVRGDEHVEEFLKPLGKPDGTSSGIDRWLETFKEHKTGDKDFTVTGEVRERKFNRSVCVVLTPLSGGGLSSSDIAAKDSEYRKELAKHPSDKWFVYFLVRPDSIDAYFAARTIAAELGYDTGWNPLAQEDPFRMNIGGGGGGKKPVVQ